MRISTESASLTSSASPESAALASAPETETATRIAKFIPSAPTVPSIASVDPELLRVCFTCRVVSSIMPFNAPGLSADILWTMSAGALYGANVSRTNRTPFAENDDFARPFARSSSRRYSLAPSTPASFTKTSPHGWYAASSGGSARNVLLARWAASPFFPAATSLRISGRDSAAPLCAYEWGRPVQSVYSLNWMRSLSTPPKSIAPICPLPIGRASVHTFAGASYHMRVEHPFSSACAENIWMAANAATDTADNFIFFVSSICQC